MYVRMYVSSFISKNMALSKNSDLPKHKGNIVN